MKSQDQLSERFHALDATRAFALLLGVVFHAAWFYVPGPLNTPVKDVSANHFYGWFFSTSHTFRMQLFFLIAGFFAALIVKRRGAAALARNRFKRIVIPFISGWAILFPLVILVWIWGKTESGQLPATLPPLKATLGAIFSGAIFVEKSQGGSFGLAHLWFLYFLILFNVAVLAGRSLLIRFFPESTSNAAERLTKFVHWAMRSPFGALTVAALMAPLLWSMKGWVGVTTPNQSLIPLWNSFAVYFLFFLGGWFLYRQSHVLPTLFHQWRFYLGAGMLLSVGLYVFYAQVRPYSHYLPPHAISYRDVSDWDAFRASLASGNHSPEEDRAIHQLSTSLAANVRALIRTDAVSFDQQVAILQSVNDVLADPDFRTEAFRFKVTLKDPRTKDQSVIPSNREAVQPYLSGVAEGDYRESFWHGPAKLAFSALYAVVMVFLVYGTLGIFQATCQKFSRIWRYLADSSYWVYLAHIPLVPAIQILIFDWQAPGFLKLTLLCSTSFVLLYGSYHYLVRSTVIGKLLNGRVYPFTWHPFAVPTGQAPKKPASEPPPGLTHLT